MDGLRTPFILHNSPEAYTYDEDIVVPLEGKFKKRIQWDILSMFL